jgi:mono/diheme cytochrome c family protein
MTRCLAGLIALFAAGLSPAEDLSRDARDVLSRRCIGCHGPKVHVSGLDLSTRASALRGGSKGPALQPGSSAASLIFQRVMSAQMPPSGALPAEEKETLRRWIDAGASWVEPVAEHRAGPDWWSLQPLHPSSPPVVPGAPEEWTRSPIDRFLLAKLREHGLSPSEPARRRTLIRRVTLDMTGLPPTPEDVESFVRDDSPSAYERLVDRLLASPRYGEHWARHWLDVARFSESEGFERDLLREHAWPYRDYVIDSLNRDKSYLQFAREQMAGDVLEPVTHEGIIATGFLVSGPTDAVGLTSAVDLQREAVREDQIEDIVSVVSQTFLGLTANCARCHDHKFDPIPQRDYYRLKAAFAGVWQPVRDRSSIELLPDGRPVLTPPEQKAIEAKTASLRARMEAIEEEMARLHRQARERVLQDRGFHPPSGVPRPFAQWTFDTDARDQAGSLHATLDESARTAAGRLGVAPGKERTTLITRELDRDLTAKSLEVWLWVDTLPEKPAPVLLIQNRIGYRGAALDGIQYSAGKKKQWQNLSTAGFRTADANGPEESAKAGEHIQIAITYSAGGTIRIYRNGVPYGAPNRPDQENPAGRLQRYVAHDAIVQLKATPGFELDEARIYDVALTDAQVAASYAAGAPSVPPEESLHAMPAGQRKRVTALESELAGLRKQLAAIPKPEKAFAADTRDPGVTYLLRRGDVAMKAGPVSPAGLSCIRGWNPELGLADSAPDAERRGKVAEWIASAENPLFSRVMVNRVWHYHFGSGLAGSPNDFGYNGGQPSHPELLDYLASEFVRSGWSLKKLHKMILTSAAYRQSSRFNARAAAKDADDRWLWRYAPRRLEGEAVRDAMLAVSGELNERMGGPSFRPFTAKTLGGSYVKYEPRDSSEPDLQRRTVYRMNVSSGGDPMLDALDCPLPSIKTPKRVTTTTPLQALSLMNGPLSIRLSKTFAARLGRDADGIDGQIARAFQLALGRDPSPAELDRSRQLVNSEGMETLCWGLFNASEFLQVE